MAAVETSQMIRDKVTVTRVPMMVVKVPTMVARVPMMVVKVPTMVARAPMMAAKAQVMVVLMAAGQASVTSWPSISFM